MALNDILKDVFTSVSDLIRSNIPELSNSGAVTYRSPASINPGPTARLSMFLYQVKQNNFLRNAPPVRNGFNTMQPAPLAVDLLYTFTPITQEDYGEMAIVEQLMQTFYDHSILDDALIKGGLAETGNNELRIVPVDMSLDEQNKLWSTFGKPYIFTLSYMITPVYIPSARVSTFTRVIQKDQEYYFRQPVGE